MLDELLSALLLIAVIATLVGASFLVWAMLSFIKSQRRIADSLEKLARKLDSPLDNRDPEKEWVIEEPDTAELENPIGSGQVRESVFKA